MDSFLLGKILAHDVISKLNGEVIVKANQELTSESLTMLVEHQIDSFQLLYTNDLDRGPYISDTSK